MNLSELIAHIGDENIRIQVLEEATTDVRSSRRGARITFYTEEITPDDLMRGLDLRAIVVWFNPDDWQRAVADAKREMAARAATNDARRAQR